MTKVAVLHKTVETIAGPGLYTKDDIPEILN